MVGSRAGVKSKAKPLRLRRSIDRSRHDRLVDLGWLIPFKTNISDVEYQVTDEGRAAAAAL
jgi:hypothetical protein